MPHESHGQIEVCVLDVFLLIDHLWFSAKHAVAASERSVSLRFGFVMSSSRASDRPTEVSQGVFQSLLVACKKHFLQHPWRREARVKYDSSKERKHRAMPSFSLPLSHVAEERQDFVRIIKQVPSTNSILYCG